MQFLPCILGTYTRISQALKNIPSRSLEGAGGQQLFFPWQQIHIFLILLFFVDMDPIGSYEAFNETLTVVKNNFRAIF